MPETLPWDIYGTNNEGTSGEGTPWGDLAQRTPPGGVLIPQNPVPPQPGRLAIGASTQNLTLHILEGPHSKPTLY